MDVLQLFFCIFSKYLLKKHLGGTASDYSKWSIKGWFTAFWFIRFSGIFRLSFVWVWALTFKKLLIGKKRSARAEKNGCKKVKLQANK